jgi:hypothetical protein
MLVRNTQMLKKKYVHAMLSHFQRAAAAAAAATTRDNIFTCQANLCTMTTTAACVQYIYIAHTDLIDFDTHLIT